MPNRPVAVDLFAGAGGLSLGLEQAGFDVLAALEYDPVHATTHRFNFPNTEVLCADASLVRPEDVIDAAARGWALHGRTSAWDGGVDLVAGGPPCQGFSWIGKRRIDDERNDLIFHFFRLVEEIHPKYFVMENVPGMLSGAHRALLEDLVTRFDAAGYRVQPPQILNAANYGVPQDRRRLFLMGSLKKLAPAPHPHPTVRPVRPVRATVTADNGGLLLVGPSVWDAIGDLPDLDAYRELIDNDCVKLSVPAFGKMTSRASPYARKLMGLDPDNGDLSDPRAWDPRRLTSSMRTKHTPASVSRFAVTEQGAVEPISRFLRLDENGLCNTLRAGTGGERGAFTSPRPIHPRVPRVISVREAARLHSFPDWFRFHVTKWNGFRQIGNSVPPLLGRAVAGEIVKALSVHPARRSVPIDRGTDSLLRLPMKAAAAAVGADERYIPKSRRVSRIDLKSREASA